MPMLRGSCHCGALTVELATMREPHQLPVRLCGCTFCKKHRPRYTSDPEGLVVVRFADESKVIRYRFGLRLADFLICSACGVFVAAVETGSAARAVINLDVLERAEGFTADPTQFTAYDSEDAEARRARRAKNWTPARIDVTPG
ncbi:MAG: hypothetical protein QM817_31675 [Archangium sp.]